ncbi:mTERF family protein [Babesia bovis T2Bo]|uniref:mTERF domain-containing protein 1, mitochondrial n=1 Tax=Babesia bovis TaxID=5865 RepID=A7ARV9_BABBO|nr:mTERF family protein [Babesia bovis T2Bo]EDO07278.1 mTERF family protein [Babesia bovis T2Bo]|eukprot:XP_001610846.1 hypothetical protein [Babesia bovis T2Bo]
MWLWHVFFLLFCLEPLELCLSMRGVIVKNDPRHRNGHGNILSHRVPSGITWNLSFISQPIRHVAFDPLRCTQVGRTLTPGINSASTTLIKGDRSLCHGRSGVIYAVSLSSGYLNASDKYHGTDDHPLQSHIRLYAKDKPRHFALRSFFGSVNKVFTDAEYDHRLELNRKYDNITDENDDSGLPLAPENEDYDVDDGVPPEDGDMTRPPSPKEDWFLKRMARGRRFWHKYFAEPSQQSLRFYNLVKMKHDLKYCNRVVRREYTELRPEIKQRVVDGKLQKLTPRERNLNKSRIQVKRTVVGFDNSSEDSNILILLTLPQRRLVHMVERIRLPHLLALRNYEMLRLLRDSMLFMSKPNIFESTVDFLLTVSRFNMDYSGDIPLLTDLPDKTQKRYRPMIYARIGRIRNDPFADHLLKVRSSRPDTIREPFPIFEHNRNSVFKRFLDACDSLINHRLANSEYDFDAVMDRNFSDNFKDTMPEYSTKESVNRIDYPVVVSFSKEMSQYLSEPMLPPSEAIKSTSTVSRDKDTENQEPPARDVSRGSKIPWSVDEVKEMLRRMHKIGLSKPSTIIDRMRRLHCDLGFSFEDILWIGRTRPQVLRYGNFYNRCLELYDSDEGFTFGDIINIVHKYPNVLTFNVPRTVRPKIRYYRRVMRRSIGDIIDFPKCLSYSLYDRIIPRHIAVMNKIYKGQFLKVYRFLFESGFYKGYGQTVTDERIPDILPPDHSKYMAVYDQVNSDITFEILIKYDDALFQQHFNLSYRDLIQGKEDALKIPLPTDVL